MNNVNAKVDSCSTSYQPGCSTVVLHLLCLYRGCVPSNTGEVNHQFLSRLLVRRLTPRPTRTTKLIHCIHLSYDHFLRPQYPNVNVIPHHMTVTCIYLHRSANIPGYTGHTHWTRMEPVHSNMTHPNPLSTARVHR